MTAPTPYVGRLPNGFWDRFSKTRTSRLYKGYRIDGDGKQFTVQGNRFTTMREAQRWVDAEVREEGAAARYHERETARALRAEERVERERLRLEKREAARAARIPKVKAARTGRGTITSRYKGYTLKRQAEGGWVVPQLDSGSVFEDKHEAKRFVDSQIYGVKMRRNSRRKNAGTSTTSYTVHSGSARKVFGYLSKAKAYAQAEANILRTSVGIDQNRHDGKRGKHWEVRPKMGNGRRRVVNAGTLVPAKLKRMPNGTIKVLVSPGAVAKLRARSTNPSMRQWDVRIPPTMQLGSYRLGPVRKTMAEAKRAALSEYNDSRRREGLSPLKSLPRGTTVREYQG